MGNTIYDIAKAAEVSIATVSRVINNTGAVNSKTRKKVLKVADEMGYHPQAFAQGLASKKKNTVAVVVPVISNYFFMEVLAGIQDQLSNHDYELNIINIKSDEDLYDQVEHLLKRQVAEGYIFISIHFTDTEWQTLDRFTKSIVIVDDYYDGFDSVSVDNVKGAYKATRYFIDEGYERIAMISALKSSKPIIHRLDGYKKALSEAEIPFRKELVVSGNQTYRDGFTEKNGYQAMKNLLSMNPRPEACFSASDIKAIGAMKAMKEAGVHIPLISYDNLTISDFIGLSTVAQPMYEMGNIACENLLKRIDTSDKKISHTIYSPELVLRDSSEPVHQLKSNNI